MREAEVSHAVHQDATAALGYYNTKLPFCSI